MLTAELDAIASWENGVRLQGLVKMNYLADVDPWLVHLTFVVAEARDDLEIERTHLFRVGGNDTKTEWLHVPGAPFRLAVGESFVRMRITDPNTGAWTDFDVRRGELRSFLAQTAKQVSYADECAALDAYMEKGLEELNG